LNFGFDARDVTLISINTDRLPEKDPAKLNIYRRLLERVNMLPGVQAASLLWFMPLSGGGWDENLSLPGKTNLSEQERDTYINTIGPRFFEVMNIPLLAGRRFTDGDSTGSESVCIINQLAARRFFPHQNPIGEHVFLDKSAIRIVGVVGDIKYLSLRATDPPEMYIPYTQKTDGIPSLTFAMKTAPGAPAIYSAFRAALREIAPDVPIELTKTMQEQVDESLGRERLMASLSIFFGTLALLLTSIGLYGTLAYAVTRRTGEIGIRIALGARGREVVWLVLRGTVGLVGLGTLAGIAAVIAASRLVRSLLYGVEPNDPGNLILAVTALLLVAALAAYVPARRASRLDPTVALREE
jgi:predicted permease